MRHFLGGSFFPLLLPLFPYLRKEANEFFSFKMLLSLGVRHTVVETLNVCYFYM